MELRHLRYFIAVAEELNFTRAAERLHIAQPPLSRQIQQLEEEIGVQLLNRNRRKVMLTTEGATFLVEARKLVADVEKALDMIRPSKERDAGQVRIGIAAGLGEKIAPVLSEYGRRYPRVEVQCNDILSGFQNDALRDRVIDVGFMRPPADSDHVVTEHLFDEPILVLVARSNPLAKRKSLRISDLADQTLLLHERKASSGIYDKILELYRKAGVRPNIAHTHTGPYEEAGTMLVANGKGVFLVGGTLTHRAFKNEVTTVHLNVPDAFFEVHVAWRKGETAVPAVKLVEITKAVFKSPTSKAAL